MTCVQTEFKSKYTTDYNIINKNQDILKIFTSNV